MDRRHQHGNSSRRSMTALAGTVVLLWAPALRADAVPPPPTTCPAGSQGETCHGGPHCRFTPCVDSSTCTGNTTCRELQWCIGTVDCWGGIRWDAKHPLTETVEGTCAGGATCSKGTCRAVRVCAPPTQSDGSAAAPAGRGCSCDVATASGDQAPLWGLSVALLLLWQRRRSRA